MPFILIYLEGTPHAVEVMSHGTPTPKTPTLTHGATFVIPHHPPQVLRVPAHVITGNIISASQFSKEQVRY